MKKGQRHSPEVRERSIRLVFEQQKQYPSQWAAITSIATKSGMTPETLRKWIRQAETDEGRRGGITSDERDRMRDLEREVKELRRANEIWKAASSFFAAELDRPKSR